MTRKKSRILWIGFALALACTIAFAVFSIKGMDKVRPDVARDVPIAGWMTPRYIGHSWEVPRRVIEEALDLEDYDGRPGPLDQIATGRGVLVSDLIAELETAIAAHRAEDDDERDGDR